jgi:hypothetical protein
MDKAWLDIEKAREQVAADLAAGREVQGSPFGTPSYRKHMFGRAAVSPR